MVKLNKIMHLGRSDQDDGEYFLAHDDEGRFWFGYLTIEETGPDLFWQKVTTTFEGQRDEP